MVNRLGLTVTTPAWAANNPLMAVVIALGLGFLVGALTRARR